MIDGPFRAVLPRFCAPLLAVYRRLGLTPNQVTGLGLVTALAAAYAVAQGANVVALGLWWLGRLFDGTDGIYARAECKASDFGGYLDILLDMAAYGAMVLGFAYALPAFALQWQLMLFLYILCITSALALGTIEERRALATAADNRSLRLASGLAEGGETGLAYSVFLLSPNGALGPLLWLWIAILLFTVVARSLLARRVL